MRFYFLLGRVIKQVKMRPITPNSVQEIPLVLMNLNSRAISCLSRRVSHCWSLVVLSFPEEMEGDSEEPESRLSWLPAPLRKPLVAGYLLANTATFVFSNDSLSLFLRLLLALCLNLLLLPHCTFRCSCM